MRLNREKLAAAMIRGDWNVKRLAQATNVSTTTIIAIRQGKSCSQATAEKLIAVLGPDIAEMPQPGRLPY